MSTTLYRKYRPDRWDAIAGQQHVKVTLSFQVATKKTAHAYLFSGPRGIGKTTVARILAKSMNCIAEDREKGKGAGEPCGECAHCTVITEGRTLDIIEIDAASHRGIDNVRDNIIENARFAPAKLTYKVFIIDEVHMLTTEAFNALLKTLEEPPAHAVFILATTELHKVPPTIVSRCQRFDFKKIPFSDLTDRLHAISEKEGCKVDNKVLQEIARHSDGCLRDAEGLLGKVLTVGDGKRISYDDALVVLPRSDFETVSSFVEALLRRDAHSALISIGDVLEGGMDLEQFAGDVVELMRKVMLTKMSGNPDIFTFDLDESRRKKLLEWSEQAEIPTLVKATELLLEKRKELKTSHPAQLPLELAVIRICEQVPVDAPVATRRPVSVTPPPTTTSQPVHKAPEETVAKETTEPKPTDATSAETTSAATQAAVEVRTDGEPVIALEDLGARWNEFVQRAGQEHHSFNYLLCSARPLEITGALVKIGLTHGFHKDKCNEEKNRRLIEKAFGELIGQDVAVEGVLLEKSERVVHTEAAEEQGEKEPAGAAADLAAAFGGTVE